MKTTLGWVAAALLVATPVSAQTMYRCYDLGKTIYSDKPCLNGDEVRQIAPNGNPTPEYVARIRMKERAEEQRATTAARAAKREGPTAKPAECDKSPNATACKP